MKFLVTKSHQKGFSLIEIVVALLILSISVITIYNLIISTSLSTQKLENQEEYIYATEGVISYE